MNLVMVAMYDKPEEKKVYDKYRARCVKARDAGLVVFE